MSNAWPKAGMSLHKPFLGGDAVCCPSPAGMQSKLQNMTFNPILKPFRWTARLKLAEFRIMFLIKQKIASILFLSYTLLKWPAIPNENCIGKFPETEVWH